MQLDRFTIKSQEALQAAIRVAADRRNTETAPAHLLLALLDQEEGIVGPVLRKVGLRGASLEPIKTIRMGDGLSVVIEVDGLGDMPGAFVGIDLRSDLDQAIATFHGRMKPPRRSHAGHGREEVVFDLGALPLMPGRYWFSIGVWDPNRSGLADRVERAISFDVVPADVYGSGYDVQSREGTVFADFEWEVRPVGNGQSSPGTEEMKARPAP